LLLDVRRCPAWCGGHASSCARRTSKGFWWLARPYWRWAHLPPPSMTRDVGDGVGQLVHRGPTSALEGDLVLVAAGEDGGWPLRRCARPSEGWRHRRPHLGHTGRWRAGSPPFTSTPGTPSAPPACRGAPVPAEDGGASCRSREEDVEVAGLEGEPGDRADRSVRTARSYGGGRRRTRWYDCAGDERGKGAGAGASGYGDGRAGRTGTWERAGGARRGRGARHLESGAATRGDRAERGAHRRWGGADGVA